ncbi:MAG: ubiquitin-like domain-containing protein [Anaerolineae bacterium]
MEIATTVPLERPYLPKTLQAFTVLLLTVGSLAAGYRTTRASVTLVIDGESRQLRTHQDTIDAVLTDAGVQLHPEDAIAPPPESSIQPGMTVHIERARPVEVSVDGQSTTLQTHATSVDEVLKQAQVTLGPYDEMRVEGDLRTESSRADRPRIVIRRALPCTLHDGDRTTTLHTTAPTVGEALREAGFTLYLADRVRPDLSTRISPGMSIHVERSTPVTVQVDGRTMRTRTHRDRTGDVLADLGIVLTGQDYTVPALDAPLGDTATIDVVRVSERFLIEQEPIPFESEWRPDPDLEIDHQRLLQEGSPGVRERRIRVRYENGQEISRTMENQYVAVAPTTKVQGYGTKIVVRTLETPSGPVEYWRKIRMLATSYSAGTAGTSRSSSWYGRTATGLTMRKGIVAVDPGVINLGAEVYVPGYGVGLAGDTGGAIKGKRIDLGFDDSNLELWYRWVDVYLLTPVPPAGRIDYTLP